MATKGKYKVGDWVRVSLKQSTKGGFIIGKIYAKKNNRWYFHASLLSSPDLSDPRLEWFVPDARTWSEEEILGKEGNDGKDAV